MSDDAGRQDLAEARGEARRVMEICNACRYCEGYCPVFPAMVRKRQFNSADLDYLANLCHQCGACYYACQYAPPHPFKVNVPEALARVRSHSWQKYAWPVFAARLFERNGLVVSLVTALSLSLLVGFVLAMQGAAGLTAVHTGPGAFYAVIAESVMVTTGGGTFLFALLAMWMGVRNFLAASRAEVQGPWRSALRKALGDAASLRHLGGGHGVGRNTVDETASNSRRWLHQITFWGFMLCFAATCTAFVYEKVFGWPSPFPYWSLPVILGTLGGAGLLIGPAGLCWVKLRSDKGPRLTSHQAMEFAFLAMLFFTSLTGLLLMLLRSSPAMSLLLAVHLGFVLAFFLLLPYSKFVHGIYRLAALMRFHQGR